MTPAREDERPSVHLRIIPPILAIAGALCAAWVGALGRESLIAATVLGVVGWVFAELRWRRGGRRLFSGPQIVLGLALLLGWSAEAHWAHLSRNWEARTQVREQQVRQQLGRELDAILVAGEDAVGRLLTRWQDGVDRASRISPLRVPRSVDALALFGPGGELLEWHGEHLGPVPRDVRLGLTPYLFRELALFAYLYVVRPLPDGSGTAMAATLLRADLPPTLDDARGDVVSRFFNRTGARIEVGGEGRITGPVAWTLTWERDVLFSVGVVPPMESEVREVLVWRWKSAVSFLLLVFWGLLAWSSRGSSWARGWSVLPLVAMASLLPRGIPGLGPRLFAPADFLLPGPVSFTLGQVLLVAAAGLVLTVYLASDTIRPRSRGLPAWMVSGLSLLLLLGSIFLMKQGVSQDLLAGADRLWIAFMGAVLLLVVVGWHLLLQTLSPRSLQAPSWLWPSITVGMVLVLGFGSAIWIQLRGPLPLGYLLLWVLPLLLLPRAWAGGRAPRIRSWLLLVVVATTAVLPWAWGARLEARMVQGEDRVQRLGLQPDPFLEYLLIRAGEEARELSRTGRSPVETLYGAWTRSGLASEGVPLWLSWADGLGVLQEELQVGVLGSLPALPRVQPLGTLVDGQVALARYGLAEQHYRMEAILPDGSRVTVVVPPRMGFEEAAPLGPLFTPARSEADPVSLLPLMGLDLMETPAQPAPLEWRRGFGAWVGETVLRLPEEGYRVRYRVPVPGPLVMVARGFLLLLVGVVTVGTLVFVGRSLRAPMGLAPGQFATKVLSFQGKLTLALFFFFVVPAILFGALAYQTLAAASVRTAETLAARAVEEAAQTLETSGIRSTSLPFVAAGVGSDLLRYEGGQLIEGSRRELVALGLYPGWIPPAVAEAITEGGEVQVTATAALGGWNYVVAFRRLADGTILAAPAALQAGATAVRQRELAELLGFALVLGGGLSLLLSLLVGRTFAQPIQTLQVASERVGAGNLRVHLPEERRDEFGSVFSAFNRMVDQRARAQRALVRSSRRTRAIVEEVATGVVAVDPLGRIVLANPRAEILLGRPLLRRTHLAEALAAPPKSDRESAGEEMLGVATWIETFLEGDEEESREEFVVGERRLRGRVRRIGVGKGRAGAVMALEDVTDELRTERILAWGEMAQQVAHEVKNPLTPMQLGIQHIQRAWADGHPDFEHILDRNAQAILTEIQRLAQVSSSFASFAAPSAETSSPLEAVSLPRVVNEVLDLYAAGSGALVFRSLLPEDLPEVQSRSDEFKEVLFNLFENARAALAGEGEVVVRCHHASEEEVHLVVSDHGPGIPAHLLSRVFEPHFSTRATGTGLGLAIVQRLVHSWGGTVSVESTEGQGTDVHLRMRPALAPKG